MSLNNFTYIPLLKNDAQLKQKSDQKKKKKEATRRSAHGHFCQSRENASPLSFLPILERKYFGRFKEKTPGPHHLFSFLPNQTHSKIFFSCFLFISPPNKHTLKPETLNNVNIFFKRKHCEFVGNPSHAICMKCKCEIYLKVRENHAYTNIRQETQIITKKRQETQIPTRLH